MTSGRVVRLSYGVTTTGIVTVLTLSLAGCQAAENAVDQASRAAVEAASEATASVAAKAVGAAVTSTLAQSGVQLTEPPTCTNDLAVDGVSVTAEGSVECTAVTTNGRDVDASFEGSLSPTSCVGTLTVNVQGQAPITTPRLDGCKIGRLVGGTAEGSSE